MMRRGALIAALASVLLLTSCAAGGDGAPGQEASYVEPEGATTAENVPAPEPIVTELPSPFDAAFVSSETAELTTDDGYKAALTVEWLPAVSLSTSELPASCVPALRAWSYEPSWTDADVSITAIPMRVSVEYPSVNGFTWPEAATISGNVSYVNPALRHEKTKGVSECVDGVTGADIRLPSSGTGGGTVEAYAISFEPRTPSNPEGLQEVIPGWLSFETTQQNDWSCNQEREFTCVFPHP